jgi:tetratricopeptide (TPR) repeat protein
MLLRIQIGAVLAAVVLGLAGCAVPSVSRPVAASPRAEDGKQARPADDYSPAAVQARTTSHALYTSAVLLVLDEQHERAAEEFFKAAMADLSNNSLTVEASSRLLGLSKVDRAIELLTNATARAGASGAVYARLGRAYAIVGKREMALEANRKAIKKSPGLFAGYQYLADDFLQNKQTNQAMNVLEEAARQPKVDAGFLIELAETYGTLFPRPGREDIVKTRALEALRRAAALKPTHPLLLRHLAEAFIEFGALEQAAETLAPLVEREPQAQGLRERLVNLLVQTGDSTNAIKHLRILVADNPGELSINYTLGRLLFFDRKPKEAVAYLTQALRLSAGAEPGYFFELARAQTGADNPNAALETLDRARKRFPQNFACEFYSAQACSKLKDYTNALKFLTTAEIIARAAKDTNRLNDDFFFQLGATYERNHKFKEAETYFRKSLELTPDFPEALNYLGYMWADRGENLKEAHEMIEKAVKLEPKNAAFLDSLGWVLFRLDQPQDALKWIQKAIEHAEEPDATLFDHLGDIFAALKKQDQAREAWQKAYSIEPSDQIQRKLNAVTGPGEAPR